MAESEDAAARPLGTFERVMYLYSEEHPRHFCVAAEIAGATLFGDYRPAFDSVQRRHPALSACIVRDARRGPVIQRTGRPVKLRIVSVEGDRDWRPVMERELSTAFEHDGSPLLRATVLHAADGATIVLTFHHSLFDAIAGASVIEDLMTALGGQPLTPLPALPSLESLLAAALMLPGQSIAPRMPGGMDVAKLRAIAASPLWRAFEGDTPTVRAIAFDEADTALVRHRSRERGTTLNGALCAAVVCAAAVRRADDLFTITSATNLRPLLGVDARQCGLLVSPGTVRFTSKRTGDFWELARQATRELASAGAGDGLLRVVAGMEACVPACADAALACGLLGSFQYDAIVTNLGALPIRTQVGSLRLEAFWGPAVLGRFTDEQVIGAATVSGRLRLVQTSARHVPSFVSALRETMLDACRA